MYFDMNLFLRKTQYKNIKKKKKTIPPRVTFKKYINVLQQTH